MLVLMTPVSPLTLRLLIPRQERDGAQYFSRQRGPIDGFMQVVQGLEWVKDNFVAPAVVVMALGGKSLQSHY